MHALSPDLEACLGVHDERDVAVATALVKAEHVSAVRVDRGEVVASDLISSGAISWASWPRIGPSHQRSDGLETSSTTR
jgi:hypothetical protein